MGLHQLWREINDTCERIYAVLSLAAGDRAIEREKMHACIFYLANLFFSLGVFTFIAALYKWRSPTLIWCLLLLPNCMWLLLSPSCRRSQIIATLRLFFLHLMRRLPESAVSHFILLPVLCIYAYFKSTIYKLIKSDTYRGAVLICALLPNEAIKHKWWCVFLVRWQHQKQEPQGCWDDGVNTFYDKLERENTAGSDGSEMSSRLSQSTLFWSQIDGEMLTKRWTGGEGSSLSLSSYFLLSSLCSVITVKGTQSPSSHYIVNVRCIAYFDKYKWQGTVVHLIQSVMQSQV